jgi:hypothetical protein
VSIAHSGHFMVPVEHGNAVKGLADRTKRGVGQSIARGHNGSCHRTNGSSGREGMMERGRRKEGEANG